MEKIVLAADIGGTSSRFAYFGIQQGLEPVMLEKAWLETGRAVSFRELLGQFEGAGLAHRLAEAEFCVFAAAGPIEQGFKCRPPNIPWEIDLTHAEEHFGIKRFALINDFLAQAFACRSPIGENARQILEGTIVCDATVAVVGAGTGLGKALLIPDDRGAYIGAASEGGHVNFCPETKDEFDFFSFLLDRLGGEYVAWDEVLSGRGLSAVHEFLTGDVLKPEEVAATFTSENETLKWAARFYGRVCRNFALETLSMGGVYIAGGIAAKNPMLVIHPLFESSFRSARVHSELLRGIPVFLIDDQESGLWGAASYGKQLLDRGL